MILSPSRDDSQAQDLDSSGTSPIRSTYTGDQQREDPSLAEDDVFLGPQDRILSPRLSASFVHRSTPVPLSLDHHEATNEDPFDYTESNYVYELYMIDTPDGLSEQLLDMPSTATVHHPDSSILSDRRSPRVGTSATICDSPGDTVPAQVSVPQSNSTGSDPFTGGLSAPASQLWDSERLAAHDSTSIIRNPAPKGFSGITRFYLAHFHVNVLEILPHGLQIIKNILPGAESIMYAAAALSASNMAMVQGCYFDEGQGSATSWKWAPNPSHLSQVHRYKEEMLAAVRKSDVNAVDLVAAYMVLLLVESEVGTHPGMCQETHNLEQLLQTHQSELQSTTSGQQLLRGMIHLRATSKSVVGPLSSSVSEFGKENHLSAFLHEITDYTDIYETLTWEAINISWRLFLLRSFDCDPSAGTEKIAHWYTLLFGHSMSDDPVSECDETPTIASLSQQLTQIWCQLRSVDLPPGLDSINDSAEMTEFEPTEPNRVVPMRFTSHEEAMKAASVGWEDVSFPIRLARQAVKAIRVELERGRIVFLAATTHRAFIDKSKVLCGPSTEVLVIHGKEQDGRYFNDWVPLDGQSNPALV
ncbi:hypothetical protein E8E14_005959 [Neopestalotiopsis sp. 37M]|nr:hypothetical protein E8E14_005959 [Neopestalotiopsis sp. 37M]